MHVVHVMIPFLQRDAVLGRDVLEYPASTVGYLVVEHFATVFHDEHEMIMHEEHRMMIRFEFHSKHLTSDRYD